MTIIYEVSVNRTVNNVVIDCGPMRVASSQPILACESAERLMAARHDRDNWATTLNQYFAYRVRELTAAEAFPELTPQSA